MTSVKIFIKQGKGPDLVFLHGWKQDKNYWRPLISHLDQNFTCWLVDLPGFGNNNNIALKNISPAGYAEWLDDFCKEQSISNFYLLGHSFGGRIAIAYAVRFNKAKKLILYAIPTFKRKNIKVSIGKFFSDKIGIKNVPYLSQLLRSKDYKETGEKLKSIFLKSVNYDYSKDLKRINIPSLIIWGERDKEELSTTAYTLKKLIPESKLEILPKCSHFAHLENPRLFAGKITNFLKNG